jgi:RNA polymerase sigma factor (sigma-70 family)
VTALDTEQSILRVFRNESARLVASVARVVRDVGVAEELAQDALVAALEEWPRGGVPDNPGAWLMTTAKHRAFNYLRRQRLLDRKHAELGQSAEQANSGVVEAVERALDDPIGDDLLSLIFVACHPLLSTEARVALTLRLVAGLTTNEIARAFLAAEPTIAQRIVRAKKTLSDANVPFEVPRGDELGARLPSVLEVVYLVFNEGYAATAGDDLVRPALMEDALRLGRLLAELVPNDAEVLGLLALMELNAARAAARTAADGSPILLLEQDRAKWDRARIASGLGALERASALGRERGAYTLQAAIAACHARAGTAAATEWRLIASLYGELAALTRSPVVALNRAVAVGMAEGPEAGLALVEALAHEPSLATYHLLPSARADLWVKLGRHAEARAEFERAASLTQNERQRERLLARARECAESLLKTP